MFTSTLYWRPRSEAFIWMGLVKPSALVFFENSAATLPESWGENLARANNLTLSCGLASTQSISTSSVAINHRRALEV